MKNIRNKRYGFRRMISLFSGRVFLLLVFFIFQFSFFIPQARAQYNVDRLITSGRVAVYYEDYILGIQYFNQALALKPYLYEPWWWRAVAKFNLEDNRGAESDATEAIKLNPYITDFYDLRAVSRIRQEDYQGAIDDYNKALSLNPTDTRFWYNRAACRMDLKDYKQAHLDCDTIVKRWEKYTSAYLLNAQMYLLQKDTANASDWLDRALKIDPYNADAWGSRAHINLNKGEWKKADELFGKAIHLKPKKVDNYINRAVARLKINNLRGAMDDYNIALNLDPNNFLAHYNRGLLCQQVGDDNKAIADFDYVLSLEPDNMMALFNRATLLDRTGNLRAAIRDYTKVINQFPNFWTGLHYRAGCYRRLGMNNKAEMDEFRILKAQMDKHLGIQHRWSRKKLAAVRKKSEIDPNKYDQIVVDDENDAAPEYKSEFRGKVQNRRVENQFQPYICLSIFDYSNAMNNYHPFLAEVDAVNKQLKAVKLKISTVSNQLTNDEIQHQFAAVDTLTSIISTFGSPAPSLWGRAGREALLARSVAYCIGQNYEDAMKDVDAYLSVDSMSSLGWWQRAICNARQADYESDVSPQTASLRLMSVNSDFEKAESLNSDNAFIFYCHGTFLAHRQDFDKAIIYFTKAIKLDSRFAEAYFNRGMAYLRKGDKQSGKTDLGKAGELGLYSAYSIIKTNSKK